MTSPQDNTTDLTDTDDWLTQAIADARHRITQDFDALKVRVSQFEHSDPPITIYRRKW